MVSKELSEYMAAIGSKGGKKRRLTSEEARALALKAVEARRKKKQQNA